MTLLGIDLGTGSTKTAVVADDGRVLGRGSFWHPVQAPAPGAAVTAPSEWLASVRRATSDALVQAGHPTIDAVGLSGQMHGVVCVDDALQPLGPALLWADVRAASQCAAYDRLNPDERRALANPVVPGMFGPLLAWVLEHERAWRDQLRWALSPKDWLRAALTGAVHTEPSDASATLLWDAASSGWSTAAIEVLGLSPQVLPPVVGSDQVAGRLHADGVELLGLAEKAPVVTGAADVAAGLIGSDLPVGQAQLSIGTGAQVVVPLSELAFADRPTTHRYRRADAHGWYAMAAVQNAGLALDWVRRTLGASWDQMHAALDHVPPGADGVTFHGYLTGERTPVLDHTARGAWQGLGLHTTHDALLRSALEGVAFAIRDATDALTAEGVAVGTVRLVGGGTADQRWRALLTDALHRTLTVDPIRDVSAVGAARLAAAAVTGAGACPRPTDADDATITPAPRAMDDLDAAYDRWRSRRPGADR